MLEIQNNVIEMKNVSKGLLDTLHTAKERLSELEDMPIETPKTEVQRERESKKMKQNVNDWDNYKRATCV